MAQLTEKEQRIFDYIKDKIEKNGYSPSIRDIRRDLDIKSTSTVHTYLEKLEKKGYIQKENGKSRTLRVDSVASGTGASPRAMIPILGRVTAGVPILAVETRHYPIAKLLRIPTPNGLVFLLRVLNVMDVRLQVDVTVPVIRDRRVTSERRIIARQTVLKPIQAIDCLIARSCIAANRRQSKSDGHQRNHHHDNDEQLNERKAFFHVEALLTYFHSCEL